MVDYVSFTKHILHFRKGHVLMVNEDDTLTYMLQGGTTAVPLALLFTQLLMKCG